MQPREGPHSDPGNTNTTVVERLWRAHASTLSAFAVLCLAALATLVPVSPVETLGWHAGGGIASAWRLISAHFVHLGPVHLAVDGLAMLLIAWSADRFGLAARLPGAALASLLAVDLGLLIAFWPIAWYVGLSGWLHGLFAWMSLRLALSSGLKHPPHLRVLAALLFLGGLAKVALAVHVPIGSVGWLGVAQATPAHLYGYLGGMLWAVLRRDR
jgi:membrane associated rhomboid family serine protease